ncbi:MAG TPA: AarF/UbiB family protein [Myxococcota bacterium]|jgi:ubiquinone biosynthesis protein
MARRDAPTLRALALRALVLFGLITRACGIYAISWLEGRGWLRGDPERSAERMIRFARRYVAAASRFRGGLIKLGQVASLRVDVMPAAVSDELAKLQDRALPHAFAEIRAQLEAELAAPLAARFAAFAEEPLASASLGQVHRAQAADGRDLAVKVLYPGIERSVAVDLAMTKLALWLFDWIAIADLMQVYRELRDSLLGEMDYLREGRAGEEIAANLARDPELAAHVRVPRIHWDLTTRRVLAMEFIEGVKINDVAGVAALGARVPDLVLWISRAFLHMMFRDGFFHCDPHPGNLMLTLDGRVGIVDFGMNRRIAPEVLAAVRKNVLASVWRDPDLYAASLVEAGMIGPADVPVVREIAKLSFDPAYYNLTPQEMAKLDFGEYFGRMRGHLKRIGSFRLPDGLVMWSRGLSLLYGLLVELAPGARPLDVLGPFVAEFLQGGAPAASNIGVSTPSKSV